MNIYAIKIFLPITAISVTLLSFSPIQAQIVPDSSLPEKTMSTDKLTDILFKNWRLLLQSFDVDSEACKRAFACLVARYSSPNRYYHTLEHIYHVLETIQLLESQTKNLTEVRLAAWFHDAIYDSQGSDNEEKSADYARNLLQSLSLPSIAIDNVVRLILITKHHQVAEKDFDGRVLVDADLAILGSDREVYWKYVRAIRQEYAWVPEDRYLVERRRVLEKFLQRKSIYLTSLMLDRAERAARTNIEAEIQWLQMKSISPKQDLKRSLD
jgi:predicted metal-dependent HD superfamily phosphohydrolase